MALYCPGLDKTHTNYVCRTSEVKSDPSGAWEEPPDILDTTSPITRREATSLASAYGKKKAAPDKQQVVSPEMSGLWAILPCLLTKPNKAHCLRSQHTCPLWLSMAKCHGPGS